MSTQLDPAGARPVHAVLVANRGEIACRVLRSCAAAGLRTVAVYTAWDRDALHTRSGHEARRVPSYLDIPALLDVARRTGVDAVHPGYGFLSENAGFAQAVCDAGLVWVGPPAAAIAQMGSKAESRRLVAAHGVPVVPGYDGDDQSDAAFRRAATDLGLPVLVKASAGGGGKGMSVVRDLDLLPEALAAARRLAAGAFGDDRLLLERYLERPRHVEVQVLADHHGTCLHLFERECSVQRRHQKVVEEAPSPAFGGEGGAERRAALWADAVRVARAVGYRNAGTVEFMVDAQGRHYFLEMNTRLQVEHPVTELTTGLDLVALQLHVARGLPLEAVPVERRGHAIEARVYAEDPDHDYLPGTGRIRSWVSPPDVRVDTGFEAGDEVGVHYDPLLAKVIAWGSDRDEARRRLALALDRLVVTGVVTNRAWLARILRHPAFAAGETHTGFLDEHALPEDPSAVPRAVLAAVAWTWARRRQARPRLVGLVGGWRTNPWPQPPLRVEVRGRVFEVSYRERADGTLEVASQRWREGETIPGLVPGRVEGALLPRPVELRLLSLEPLHLEIDDMVRPFVVDDDGDQLWVHQPEATLPVRMLPDLPLPEAISGRAHGPVAPMPGKVVQVAVAAGDGVTAGQVLVVLEAMKMEQAVRAAEEGTVAAVHVAVGEQVDAGQVLVTLERAGPDEPITER